MKFLKTTLIMILVMFFCTTVLQTKEAVSEEINIHGFVSQGYLKSSDNNFLTTTEEGSFEFNEMGINFSTVYNKLRIGAQIFSRDLGTSGNNKMILDWAVADYKWKDSLGFRAGKIKTPLGFYSQSRDADMLRTPILLPSSVYDEGTREMVNAYNGFGIYGNLSAKKAGDFEYEVWTGTFNVTEVAGNARNKFDRIAQSMSQNGMLFAIENPVMTVNYAYGAALRWNTPMDGLRFGATYFLNDISTTFTVVEKNSGMTNNDGLETEYKRETYSVEYIKGNMTLASEVMTGNLKTDTNSERGWYCQAAYQLTDWLNTGIYYSEYYPDWSDKDGTKIKATGLSDYYARQNEIVPTLRFDINGNWLVKLETHFINGTANTLDYMNTDGRKENWAMYSLKTTVNF